MRKLLLASLVLASAMAGYWVGYSSGYDRAIPALRIAWGPWTAEPAGDTTYFITESRDGYFDCIYDRNAGWFQHTFTIGYPALRRGDHVQIRKSCEQYAKGANL